jgi:hypothetical protein
MQSLDLIFSLVAAAMIALLVGAVARDALGMSPHGMRLSALSVAGFVIVPSPVATCCEDVIHMVLDDVVLDAFALLSAFGSSLDVYRRHCFLPWARWPCIVLS